MDQGGKGYCFGTEYLPGWRWLSTGQYAHVSAMVAEIGRLLGGWLKQSAQ